MPLDVSCGHSFAFKLQSIEMLLLFVLMSVLSAAAFSAKSIPLPDNPAVKYHPRAFTPAETAAIIIQMTQLPVEFDDRIDKSVKRTNYFDKGIAVTSPDSKYRWIFEKIWPLYASSSSSSNEAPSSMSLDDFVSRIDFILLHEFTGGGFFDWHVDVKPGDNTGRTDNINVMLSESSQYEGGVLTVGCSNVPAQQGDCYSYPASFPHKVGDITKGRRHTFIIAMLDSPPAAQADESTRTVPTLDEYDQLQRRQEYWRIAEENHKHLCDSNPSESKLHLLYGEFLAALGRPDCEIDAKFADMYASTNEAVEYANTFQKEGEMLQQAGRTKEASGCLNMANMIRTRLMNKKLGVTTSN